MITLSSPFPELETPTLWHWLERWTDSFCDPALPTSFDDWSARQDALMEGGMGTWAIYQERELAGYFEARRIETPAGSSLTAFAECRSILKPQLWKQGASVMHACFEQVFADDPPVDIVFAPASTRPIANMYHKMGCVLAGDIALYADAFQFQSRLYVITRDNFADLSKFRIAV